MNLAAAPPPFLQLAAHPLRWRLMAELALSDRAVSELTARTGEPQNLVSYHLAKLRDARIVSARRSSADRRDAYYGLDLRRLADLLAGAGAALHPGLRLAPARAAAAPPARVLFLCTGNSARSQMAEALIRAHSGGRIAAASAGSHPRPLHPNAVRALREGFGIDIEGQESKPLETFAGERFDWVVSLCDKLREVCPDYPGWPEALHWSLPNPATGEPDEATYPLFQETAAELARRIEFLLALIAERTSPAA